jgi:hypothetical protein
MGFALCYPSIHGMEALQVLAAQRVAEVAERGWRAVKREAMRQVFAFLRRHLLMTLAGLVLIAVVVVLWLFSAPIPQRDPPGGGVPLGRSPMGGDPRKGPPGGGRP